MRHHRISIPLVYAVLICVITALAAVCMTTGAVDIPLSQVWAALTGGEVENRVWSVIVTQSRMPHTVTALMAGAALACGGLMLQTLFANPLADPSILGVSSGAGLGVAAVMLASGGAVGSLAGTLSTVAGAMAGATAVLALIIALSTVVRSNVMLLVVGLMIGYMASSAVSLLSFMGAAESVKSFSVWGMGDFGGVSPARLPYFVAITAAGLVWALLMMKPMNAMLLGESYCRNLGVGIKKLRISVLLSTGLLTAVVTAFCGPVSFIGLAVPHMARLLTATSDHRVLMPVTMLLGAAVALLCNLLTMVLGAGNLLPLNVVTPLLGAPVIIYVIVNKRKIAYFN